MQTEAWSLLTQGEGKGGDVVGRCEVHMKHVNCLVNEVDVEVEVEDEREEEEEDLE